MLEVHKQTLKLLLGVNGKSDRMFSDRSHWNHSAIILCMFYVNSVHVYVLRQLSTCVRFTSTQYMFPFGFLCTRNWFGMHVCPLTPYISTTSTLFILFRDNFSLHALYL